MPNSRSPLVRNLCSNEPLRKFNLGINTCSFGGQSFSSLSLKPNIPTWHLRRAMRSRYRVTSAAISVRRAVREQICVLCAAWSEIESRCSRGRPARRVLCVCVLDGGNFPFSWSARATHLRSAPLNGRLVSPKLVYTGSVIHSTFS